MRFGRRLRAWENGRFVPLVPGVDASMGEKIRWWTYWKKVHADRRRAWQRRVENGRRGHGLKYDARVRRRVARVDSEGYHGLGRLRWVAWVEHFMVRWLGGGVSVERAATQASMDVFYCAGVPRSSGMSMQEKRATSKGLEMLSRPEVCAAVEAVFAEQGLTFAEAVKLHVEHIRGATEEVVLKDGTVVPRKLPPSLAALRDYEKLVLPAQTQRVQIDRNDTLTAVVMSEIASGSAPTMNPRVLPGSVVVE